MKIFKQIEPLRAFLDDARRQGKSVGLVPTMGALHQGHIALIKASQAENEITVCTIFVNPTQFNNPDDLARYPRTLSKDTELLKEVHCDVLFCPETEELYPEKSIIKIEFGHLDKVMEGRFRPGHFSGVGLVVAKLFNITQPDRAYFGQKDWQQFAIIRQLTEELKFNISLRSIPTLREEDGLAMSSRNLRLNAEERHRATLFYKALKITRDLLEKGEKIAEVKKTVSAFFEQQPGIRLEYLEVADSKNLNLLENVDDSDRPIICIAGYVGDVRLIDNMFFDKKM